MCVCPLSCLQTLTDGTPRAPLFLKRTLPEGGKGNTDELLVAALQDVFINNNLETKIAPSTCKVSLILYRVMCDGMHLLVGGVKGLCIVGLVVVDDSHRS